MLGDPLTKRKTVPSPLHLETQSCFTTGSICVEKYNLAHCKTEAELQKACTECVFFARNLQIFIFRSPNDVLQSLYLYGFVKGATSDCVFGYMVGAVFQPDFRPFEGGSFFVAEVARLRVALAVVGRF